MTDITKCDDHECPRNVICWRYTSPCRLYGQSYFMNSPRNKETDGCNYFMTRKYQEDYGIINKSNSITDADNNGNIVSGSQEDSTGQIMEKCMNDDEIIVRVGGKEYQTFIDDKGVQRFKANSVLDYLSNFGIIDLNAICLDYHEGKFSKIDYAEFNMMLGYSVCGFCDLNEFEDMEIYNPLWEKN